MLKGNKESSHEQHIWSVFQRRQTKQQNPTHPQKKNKMYKDQQYPWTLLDWVKFRYQTLQKLRIEHGHTL